MASVALTRNEGQDNFVGVRGGEPRLTNVTVDGFNMPFQDPGIREFDFFSVPSGIVSSVQLSKTLSANMDGDGIGDSINLVTKTASDTPDYQTTALGGIGAMNGWTPAPQNTRPNAQVYGAKFRSMHKYNNAYQVTSTYAGAGAGAGIPMTDFPNQPGAQAPRFWGPGRPLPRVLPVLALGHREIRAGPKRPPADCEIFPHPVHTQSREASSPRACPEPVEGSLASGDLE